MKKILVLATGGTIASRHGDNGLAPAQNAKELVDSMGNIHEYVDLVCEDLFSLDSSNIQPEQWQIIAHKIYSELDTFDGFVVAHGTDTMAYTASALSFMFRNLKKSIVLTGSQLPMEHPMADAKNNMFTALETVNNEILGVTLAFNRKVINGTRAVKISTLGFDAFACVNASYMGEMYADGMRVYSRQSVASSADVATTLESQMCEDVFLLKLLPGTKPEIFDMLAAMHYKGIVIEAFGIGGVHYLQRDLLHKINSLVEQGISVVVCSQCLYERSDLSFYEVGRRLLQAGVISAWDMTTEATGTKLMWALAKTNRIEEVADIFSINYAGEVSF